MKKVTIKRLPETQEIFDLSFSMDFKAKVLADKARELGALKSELEFMKTRMAFLLRRIPDLDDGHLEILGKESNDDEFVVLNRGCGCSDDEHPIIGILKKIQDDLKNMGEGN
jgi:hypothetical protein